MGRLGSSGSARFDFTDGDTLKRFTVTDASIEGTEQISPAIQRQQVADNDDPGWIFIPNVLQVRRGGFDVLVAALSGDGTAGINEFPNEVVTLTYLID